jgi:hypothetical protein
MVNLPIEYSDKPVTPFGGMVLMKRFLDQTGIREQLGKPMPSQSTHSRLQILPTPPKTPLDGLHLPKN